MDAEIAWNYAKSNVGGSDCEAEAKIFKECGAVQGLVGNNHKK